MLQALLHRIRLVESYPNQVSKSLSVYALESCGPKCQSLPAQTEQKVCEV